MLRKAMPLSVMCRVLRHRSERPARREGPIRSDDHAFANGQAHLRPRNLLDAVCEVASFSGGLQLRSVWRRFAAQSVIGEMVRLSVTARLINLNSAETVVIKPEAVIRGIIRNEANGSIAIGSCCYIGDDVLISAAERIVIGDSTLVAHGVQIFDNDTHPLDPFERELHFMSMLGRPNNRTLSIAAAPVRIGRRCWIGMNSLIMKGVSIGENTIVAAGSVVTNDLPGAVVAAGNPAVPIKRI